MTNEIKKQMTNDQTKKYDLVERTSLFSEMVIDFCRKIKQDIIAKKEIKETKYWLRTITYTVPEIKNEARKIWQECQELNLIFATIINKAKL